MNGASIRARRSIAIFVTVSVLWPTVASARGKSSRSRVVAELVTGEVVTGEIVQVGRRHLVLRDEAGTISVSVADIRAVTDVDSGQQFQVQPNSRIPHPGHTSV